MSLHAKRALATAFATVAAALSIMFAIGALTADVLAAEAQLGIFALQGGSAKAVAYMDASPSSGPALTRNLRFWMAPQTGGGLITSYDVDMTKRLHVLLISDDFRTFLHVHPALHSDGQFVITQRLPRAALYRVYIDGVPHGIGQQVFRFDLRGGGRAAARDLSERRLAETAGPYRVAISSLSLSAGVHTALTVHITKRGAPAGDLHPYLGTLAHAVFINAKDLSYLHVHPVAVSAKPSAGAMDMPGMNMSGAEMKPMPDGARSRPNMRLDVTLAEPGTYKLWIQFRGGRSGTLYVAPFVLRAI